MYWLAVGACVAHQRLLGSAYVGTKQLSVPAKPRGAEPQRLKDALRKARIDQAERTGVVVDLHDAEVARLELLNEALDPLFAEIPPEVDLFDRGISRGETPRLWIDAVAHVVMGRDKRVYRFVQDTRYGRKVLAESMHIPEMADAVTKYVAQRLIERERALANAATVIRRSATRPEARARAWSSSRHRVVPVRPVRGVRRPGDRGDAVGAAVKFDPIRLDRIKVSFLF